jgi:hypothetical protein
MIMAHKVTLDTNLIIDLEEGRGGCDDILRLIDLNNKGNIEIFIPAIMASEKMIFGQKTKKFQDFLFLLRKLGFDRCINDSETYLLKPMAVFDVTFWDWGIFAFDEGLLLEKNIQKILFPNFEFNYQKYCKLNNIEELPVNKKWINKKCDVAMMWAHIYYGNNVFLTRNTKDFCKVNARNKLLTLGAKYIGTPQEFLQNYF